MRCGPRGTKEHSGGHGSPPKTHWFSKDPQAQAFYLTQMGSGGEAIRTRADDGNITEHMFRWELVYAMFRKLIFAKRVHES
jgi:hypothetical protein